MKKLLIFILAIFFVSVPVVMAQQNVSDEASPQDMTAPIMVPPAGYDMYPVVRETVDVLRELLDSIKGCKFAEQNPDLIQKAEDVIKRGENALSEFDAIREFPDSIQP